MLLVKYFSTYKSDILSQTGLIQLDSFCSSAPNQELSQLIVRNRLCLHLFTSLQAMVPKTYKSSTKMPFMF
jgi:hypothetical protein